LGPAWYKNTATKISGFHGSSVLMWILLVG